ncbi:hypothetical protein MUCCIDRAFT_85526 [Mucor lusitanicus CBS 277.49]|uniref:Uncharacterized protein n=1 Tax=Mucor lusitanicus CBS 277.49 TaxID=747725 RepID=A0A168HMY7_MUCCL|nr:hypothetical protein MUCCIDRAFT_85526 [Mucor lusitanicus CBS 277.49]
MGLVAINRLPLFFHNCLILYAKLTIVKAKARQASFYKIHNNSSATSTSIDEYEALNLSNIGLAHYGLLSNEGIPKNVFGVKKARKAGIDSSVDGKAKENLTVYVIERAQCTIGVDGGPMKVQSIYVDLKHLVSEAKDHALKVPKNFVGDLYVRCQGLAKLGLLSTKGKPKLVVDVSDVKLVVAALFTNKKRKTYYLQLAVMILIILYSGVRLSSLVPKEKALEEDWEMLRWENNITIYRQGRDADGDAIVLRIDFQHVKCKDIVLNQADHTFSRTFTSVADKYLDLGSLLVALLVAQDYLTESIQDWYASGKITLAIKDDAKKKPVFCRNDFGGHKGVLTDLPWNTQYATHAIKKAFEKANMKDITAYSLRRFFIQKAQALADDSKVASLAGHHPKSVVQYTKYGSTFATLDIVKMIQEDHFDEIENANKYIEGLRCTQQLFKRMSTEEYQQEVAPHIKKEKAEYDAVVVYLKAAYGDKYKDLVDKWSPADVQKYRDAYRKYTNAQDRYRRQGLKKLSEERRQKAFQEMTVNENGDVVFIVAIEKKKVNKTADF